MCIAPTGSGKTLSYLLPTLVSLQQPARKLAGSEEAKGIRSIIIVPTHDLAVQIHGVLKAITTSGRWRCLVLSKATQQAVCESAPGSAGGRDEDADSDAESTGSVNEFEQKGSATGLGIDVLIATPERLHHLLEANRVSLSGTRHVILDESDRLLSPDFRPQVEPIVDACTHAKVQKCLLSATMPAGAEQLARRWLRNGGVRVVVGVK
jgi:ATP-dependent RNA helicase DDX52/ROK1